MSENNFKKGMSPLLNFRLPGRWQEPQFLALHTHRCRTSIPDHPIQTSVDILRQAMGTFI